MYKILITFLVLFYDAYDVTALERPVIGILSQEFEPADSEKYTPATSHIITTYVKAVESAGARVVPIFIKQSYTYYRHLLHSINGVVIPGGMAELQPGNGYYDALSMIYKIAQLMNDRGIYFPIFGVCLGFEAMLMIANKNMDIQTRCDIVNEYYPLIFLPNYQNSLMYSDLPQELYIYLKYNDVTGNWHYWCTTRENFTRAGLDKDWLVTTINHNRRGLEFISSVEHKKYPFFAVQFHPERQFSEFFPQDTKKYTRTAIKTNRYYYELLVDLAKMNNNYFSNEQELRKLLINQFQPLFSKQPNSYVQLYAFKN